MGQITIKRILSRLLIITLTILLIISCNNTEKKENNLEKKETELLKKENELLKKEIELSKNKSNSNRSETITKTLLEKEFNKHIKTIEKNFKKGMEECDICGCSFNEAFIGDLNNDGIDDGLVQYLCNYSASGEISSIAIFLNINNELKYICSEENGIYPTRIANNIIYGKTYDYGENDRINNPTAETEVKLKLKNNSLVVL
jgi:hypothetical protein